MVLTRSLGKKPLPGERQGVSGVAAGHSSMRYGDVQNQEVENNERPFNSQPSTSANRAAVDRLPRTTRKSTRLKWTREMNVSLLKCYLRTNECRDDPLPGWRHKLHDDFHKKYPNLKTTEQNLCDRIRLFYRGKNFSQEEIDETRREVARELHNLDNGIQQTQEHIIEETTHVGPQ